MTHTVITFSVGCAADELNVSESYIRRLLASGELRSLSYGDVAAYKEQSDAEGPRASYDG